MPTTAKLIACHECDQLQREIPLEPGGAALCCRCGALLYRNALSRPDRPLALLLAAAILFVIANVFPIVAIESQGTRNALTLFGAIGTLWDDDMPIIAALVLFTTILAPAFELAATLFVLAALYWRKPAPGLPLLLRWILALEPWNMTEVFMLGLLVSLVKLAHFADIMLGVSLWAYAGVMLLLAATSSTLDAHDLWTRVSRPQ